MSVIIVFFCSTWGQHNCAPQPIIKSALSMPTEFAAAHLLKERLTTSPMLTRGSLLGEVLTFIQQLQEDMWDVLVRTIIVICDKHTTM